jgi:hypothetical protein
MAEEERVAPSSGKILPGPYLAKIVSHLDPKNMGVLQVQLLREAGNDEDKGGQLHTVKYMSPFAGQTPADFVGEEDDYDNTQKSYGMWMVPPDPGTVVVVIFIDGNPRKGYWMGCVPDEKMNFQVPGHAATSFHVDGIDERVPVAEYNRVSQASTTDPTTIPKPASPLQDVLDSQGLLRDDIRGITTSSARRETPSSVFGISTPGPIDKRSGAKTGRVGKSEDKVAAAFVSRLGGTSFVMDDGDDKFVRKTKPTDGPPDYAALEQDDDLPDDPTMPHNELFRIRTRTGHQILLHNSEDLIYITNSRGTAWIELSSDGKIDIYAKDSISIRTENDFNFYADRDFNIEVGRNFNLKVADRHQTEIGGDKILIVNGNNTIGIDGTHDETIAGATTISHNATLDIDVGAQTNLTVGGGFDLNTSGANKLTSGGNMEISAANTTISGGNINLNGPGAAAAGSAASASPPTPLSTFDNPTEDGGTINSIMLRIPTTEPYPHHENLDATLFKTDLTDRESGSAIEVPEFYKTYTTITDTFAKIKGDETPPEEQPTEI